MPDDDKDDLLRTEDAIRRERWHDDTATSDQRAQDEGDELEEQYIYCRVCGYSWFGGLHECSGRPTGKRGRDYRSKWG